MATIVYPLTADTREDLHSMALSLYLDGQCYAFATAMQELTEWPIIALEYGHPIRHALVRAPNGEYWDVRGSVSIEELGEPFGARPPYTLREVTVDDLRAVRDVIGVARARLTIEALWPDLAEEHGRLPRLREFANRLEALSRELGIWLSGSASAPSSFVFLRDEDGFEKGYALTPDETGCDYTINRRFA